MSPDQARDTPNHTLAKKLYYEDIMKRGLKKLGVKKEGDSIVLFSKTKKFKYKVGDSVVISAIKTAFHHGYLPQWTGEVFFVTSREVKQGVIVYTVKSWDNELVQGSFYESEISPVYVPNDTSYVVEKVIDRRIKNNTKESLVKWVGFPSSHMTWVPTSAIVNRKVLKSKLFLPE